MCRENRERKRPLPLRQGFRVSDCRPPPPTAAGPPPEREQAGPRSCAGASRGRGRGWWGKLGVFHEPGRWPMAPSPRRPGGLEEGKRLQGSHMACMHVHARVCACVAVRGGACACVLYVRCSMCTVCVACRCVSARVQGKQRCRSVCRRVCRGCSIGVCRGVQGRCRRVHGRVSVWCVHVGLRVWVCGYMSVCRACAGLCGEALSLL